MHISHDILGITPQQGGAEHVSAARGAGEVGTQRALPQRLLLTQNSTRETPEGTKGFSAPFPSSRDGKFPFPALPREGLSSGAGWAIVFSQTSGCSVPVTEERLPVSPARALLHVRDIFHRTWTRLFPPRREDLATVPLQPHGRHRACTGTGSETPRRCNHRSSRNN